MGEQERAAIVAELRRQFPEMTKPKKQDAPKKKSKKKG